MSKLSKLFDRFKATKSCILIERLGKTEYLLWKLWGKSRNFVKLLNPNNWSPRSRKSVIPVCVIYRKEHSKDIFLYSHLPRISSHMKCDSKNHRKFKRDEAEKAICDYVDWFSYVNSKYT